jgi:hypothetical protein
MSEIAIPSGNRHKKFIPLRCPLCGGELIYSQGSHDLICERNRIDNELSISTDKGGGLIPRSRDMDPPRGDTCIFAASFTPSAHSGILFNVRIERAEVNYNALAELIREILTRKPGKLARNYKDAVIIQPAQKKKAAQTDERLARKLGLEIEDVFSIKHSTETIKNLAQFYGISEGNVRIIKRTNLHGTPDRV